MFIRDATTDDASHLAFLINLAGEGLPEYQWRQMAGERQDPLTVGALRASREDSLFSYRHARIAEIDGHIAGMLLSYQLPDPYATGDLESSPSVIRPLVELEAMVPGSWYLNAIATYEQFRGRGVGTALMAECDSFASAARARKLSLIVASENQGALALYQKLGYLEIASRPLKVFPGGPDGGEWLLMVRSID